MFSFLVKGKDTYKESLAIFRFSKFLLFYTPDGLAVTFGFIAL